MSEWQLASTAPANVSVLVWIPEADHYGPPIYRAILVDAGSGRRWMTTGLGMSRDCDADNQPAHWQPLGPPPEL